VTAFAPPVVATYGETDPAAPLVVLLHGRGSNEREILSLAPSLPDGAAYAAVRAPITEGGGYAWFANRGIGRPVAESLAATMSWFRGWLEGVAPGGRPVVLVGFSGGAAFAGGLILDDPARYAGAAILYGTLPFGAGMSVEAGHLAHLPVFVAQGDADQVIPVELLTRTWDYLLGESAAPATAHRDAGGHGLTAPATRALHDWLTARLHFVGHRTAPTAGPRRQVAWPTMPGGRLPVRRGPHPSVSWNIPQQQVSDNAPSDLQERLFATVRELPGVHVAESRISVPGARALILDLPAEDADAFLVPSTGEFAHLHPSYDGSLHLALPADLAADLVTRGWGRMHPWAGTRLSPGLVMVYGPRDEAELVTVRSIVAASHAYATGELLCVMSRDVVQPADARAADNEWFRW
jgi:phospholipase/carboxylesterase